VAKLRVHNLAVSIDGYAAGPHQDVDNPLGVGGRELHQWVFATAFGQAMVGMDVADDAERGVDNAFMEAGVAGIGATIMGRNMFGPVRGLWEDSEEWNGWWGPEPPYHHPVFVLTHHARPPLEMGETTFHFVTDGIESAYAQAMEAAGGADVRLGGGAATVNAYLRAGLVDELHMAVAPVLLGAGERLLDDVGTALERYAVAEVVSSPAVTHVRITRTDG
jgi:dihydrofolate reductase